MAVIGLGVRGSWGVFLFFVFGGGMAVIGLGVGGS